MKSDDVGIMIRDATDGTNLESDSTGDGSAISSCAKLRGLPEDCPFASFDPLRTINKGSARGGPREDPEFGASRFIADCDPRKVI